MKAQLLVEIELAPPDVSVSVTRFYDAKWQVLASKPLFKGQELNGVRLAILDTLKDMKEEWIAQHKPKPEPGSPFSDKMEQTDGIGVALQCAHPNINPGGTCPHCGATVPL